MVTATRKSLKTARPEVLRLRDAGKTRKEISEITGLPMVSVHRAIRGAPKLPKEVRRAHHAVANAVEYPVGTTEKILEMRAQGVKRADIAVRLGVSVDKVGADIQTHGSGALDRETLLLTRPRKYTAEQESEVLRLRSAGTSIEDITTKTGVEGGSVRALLTAHGVKLTKEQKKTRALLTPEQQDEAVEMRRSSGLEVSAIAAKFGVKKDVIKVLFANRGVKVSKETAVANSTAGLARMSPEAKAAVVAANTAPDVLVRRRAAITDRYRDPELRALKGRQSAEMWTSRSPEEREVFADSRRGIRSPWSQISLGEFTTHGDRYRAAATELGGRYLGPEDAMTHDKAEWECGKGHRFTSSIYPVLAGHFCPYCGFSISKAQMEVVDYLRGILPGAEIEVSTRSVISPYELDIYVPHLKLAVEYNGLFWHSSARPPFKTGREMKKAEACHAKGLRLLMIFQDEWAQKRSLIEAMLRHRCGIPAATVLDARKLDLVEIEKGPEIAEFLDRSHLAGSKSFGWGLGLRTEEGVLVAVATVKRSFNKNRELELSRFAVAPDTVVRGAAGRLITAIRRRIAEPLTSFSDNRLSSGEVYRQLGFVEVKRRKQPSYFYTDCNGVREWRFKCRRVSGEPGTEEEQALRGFLSTRLGGKGKPMYRIEDAGHKKWIVEPLGAISATVRHDDTSDEEGERDSEDDELALPA